MRTNNRWVIAIAGVFLQIALGAVYAWGVLYGLGVFLARLTHRLSWLYLTYGVIGGIALGLRYIVPGRDLSPALYQRRRKISHA